MSIIREKTNPIIRVSDVVPSRDDYEVIGVFNAGAIEIDGRTLLLLRVAEKAIEDDPGKAIVSKYNVDKGEIEKIYFDKNDPDIDCTDPRTVITKNGNFVTSIGHVRAAWSDDGSNFTVDEKPLIFPGAEYETYGIEDPRIVNIDGEYCITYSAVSDYGIVAALITSKDMKAFERRGIVFPANNKNVVLFPEKIDGKYVILHRPFGLHIKESAIWMACSPDLAHWGGHRTILTKNEGSWHGFKLGPGAPPIRTKKGWLEIYHGVDENETYSLGALLLDINDPSKVLARSEKPIMSPKEPYEVSGLVDNVVFTCGVIKRADGRLDIYYGACDETLCAASVNEKEILDVL